MSRHPRVRPLTRRPTVTVVIPCFNYGRYLPLALSSALDQPGVDVDVIIVDDASTDGSSTVVRELARTDERIRAIVRDDNRGHIATYNEGLEQATGEFVVLLSADDALAPGALARATALMVAEPSLAFTYGLPVEFSEDLPDVSTRVRSWTVWSGHEWLAKRCERGSNCIHCPEVVMRTSVQHAIGGYDAGLPHSGDLEMWMRAALAGDVGRVNGAVQGLYRVHGQSMQRTVFAGRLHDLDARLAAFEKVLLHSAARPADGEELLARARRALADAAVSHAWNAFHCDRAQLEPVDEYLAFATRVWPQARAWRKWRVMSERSAEASPLSRHPVARLARTGVIEVKGRTRWRRWRWSGV